MSGSGYRPLLPATRPRSPSASEPVQKRKRVTVACNACRGKRIGCDGNKPSCAACERGRRECVYMSEDDVKTLREKVAAFQEIMGHLKNRPQHVTQGVLQRLSTGSDPITVLKTLKGEMPEAVVSEQDTARAFLPIILSDCEFELLVRHPNAYPTIDLAAYARSSHSTIPNEQYQAVTTRPKQVLQPRDDEVIGPLEAVQYYDARLSRLDIEFWTHVPITNTLAAGAISLYLETQLPVWGCFDATLFVGDLVDGKFEFCSPFMVSSLLAIALQGYALLDSEAAATSYIFEEEAKKLYSADGSSDTLPHVAGCMLLYMSIAAHTDVPEAVSYLDAAFQSSKRMNLFKDPSSDTSVSLQHTIAASKAAWGVFSLYVLMTPFHVTAPLKHPPAIPIYIHSDTDSHPHSHEKSGMKEVISTSLDLDGIWVSLCKLRVIINEVYIIYRDSTCQSGSLAFALSKYHQILQLADRLPGSLTRQSCTSSCNLLFHMFLHMAILDIFRPFICEEKQHGFSSYQPKGPSPITIFAASVQQLKGLLYEYATHYKPHQWHLIVNCAVIYTVNAVVKNELDPDRRAYLSFYVNMLQRGVRSYLLLAETVQALLVIAIDKGVITSPEALAIVQNPKGWASAARDEGDEGGWVVDMGMAVNDVTAAGVHTLVSRFETIVLFDNFTQGLA